MNGRKQIFLLLAVVFITLSSAAFADVTYEDWMGDDYYLYVTVTNEEYHDIYLTDVVIRFYYEDGSYEDLIWEYDEYYLESGYYLDLGPFGGNYDDWDDWDVLEINYVY